MAPDFLMKRARIVRALGVYGVINKVSDCCLELIIMPDGIHEPRRRRKVDGTYNMRV